MSEDQFTAAQHFDQPARADAAQHHEGVLHRVRESVAAITHATADGFGSALVRESMANARDARLSHGSRGHDLDAEQERSDAMKFEARLAPLSRKQRGALDLLSMGKSVVATAKSLKVDPSTIHRWKSTSPLFIAELNRRHASLYDNIVVKLRLTLETAVEQLHEVLTGPNKRDRMEAVWKLLPMLKPQRLIVPSAPTSPIAILNERVRVERLHNGEVAEMPITDEDRLAQVWPEDRADFVAVDPKGGDA